MKLLGKIKAAHILYVTGILFAILYVYATLDYAAYSYKRWGKFDLELEYQWQFIYVLAYPFVLAIHIQKPKSDENLQNPISSRYSLVVRVIRVIYLSTIALLPLFFSAIVADFFISDFNGATKPINIELAFFILVGLLSPLCSYFMFRVAFKYR